MPRVLRGFRVCPGQPEQLVLPVRPERLVRLALPERRDCREQPGKPDLPARLVLRAFRACRVPQV